MKRQIKTLGILFLFFIICSVSIQAEITDSVRIDYRKIYSYCLDADMKSVMDLIKVDKNKVSEKDHIFICELERRFACLEDKSDFITEHSSVIDPLLLIFHEYWREALLATEINIDSTFLKNVSTFFSKEYSLNTLEMDEETLDSTFMKYIADKELYATAGIGKTGKLYDLLVWKNQQDSVFSFHLHDEELNVRVILMKDFITLGWEEYATLGRYYPGGWATDEALFCVAESYDMNSEKFLVSYLAHEGRHFSDYKLFPKLKSTDLEYRAKLTELSLAQTTLFDLIQLFITNSNANSEGGHSKANYLAISDMSKRLFDNDFESDIEKWKTKGYKTINDIAYLVLKENTDSLLKITTENGRNQ